MLELVNDVSVITTVVIRHFVAGISFQNYNNQCHSTKNSKFTVVKPKLTGRPDQICKKTGLHESKEKNYLTKIIQINFNNIKRTIQ